MASKEKKEKSYPIEVFSIDGMEVELRGIPPRLRKYSIENDQDGNPIYQPDERNLYEVRADGAFVGWVTRPFGFGKQPYRLERLNYTRLHERYAYGREQPYNDPYLYQLSEIAAKVPRLRRKVDFYTKLADLHTAEEFKAYKSAKAAENRRQAAEQAEKDKLAREQRAAQKAADEQLRLDTVEGLQGISARLGKELTNFEMNALRRAIEHFAVKPYDYWQGMTDAEGKDT